MIMKIQPRNEHVVLRQQEQREQRTIVIPGEEHEENRFVVVAVGPGGLTVNGGRMPIEVIPGVPLAPGHVVLVRGSEYEGFKDGNTVMWIVPQAAILGVEVEDTH
jgi:co-chaperonin GroES (HSP10)